LRNLREADNVIKFLERLKQEINDKEKEIASDIINIIVNHYTKKSKNES
jgi:hypothetical protein